MFLASAVTRATEVDFIYDAYDDAWGAFGCVIILTHVFADSNVNYTRGIFRKKPRNVLLVISARCKVECAEIYLKSRKLYGESIANPTASRSDD